MAWMHDSRDCIPLFLHRVTSSWIPELHEQKEGSSLCFLPRPRGSANLCRQIAWNLFTAGQAPEVSNMGQRFAVCNENGIKSLRGWNCIFESVNQGLGNHKTIEAFRCVALKVSSCSHVCARRPQACGRILRFAIKDSSEGVFFLTRYRDQKYPKVEEVGIIIVSAGSIHRVPFQKLHTAWFVGRHAKTPRLAGCSKSVEAE